MRGTLVLKLYQTLQLAELGSTLRKSTYSLQRTNIFEADKQIEITPETKEDKHKQTTEKLNSIAIPQNRKIKTTSQKLGGHRYFCTLPYPISISVSCYPETL